MRDDSGKKPCILFLAREVQRATKPAKARAEEEKGLRPFGLVSTAPTERWRIRPWPFTPRAAQAISFGGPVAEEKLNLCYVRDGERRGACREGSRGFVVGRRYIQGQRQQ